MDIREQYTQLGEMINKTERDGTIMYFSIEPYTEKYRLFFNDGDWKHNSLADDCDDDIPRIYIDENDFNGDIKKIYTGTKVVKKNGKWEVYVKPKEEKKYYCYDFDLTIPYGSILPKTSEHILLIAKGYLNNEYVGILETNTDVFLITTKGFRDEHIEDFKMFDEYEISFRSFSNHRMASKLVNHYVKKWEEEKKK